MKQWRLFAGLEVLRNWPLANLQSKGLLKKASVMTFVLMKFSSLREMVAVM
jgi:hypothetical protein